MKAHLLFEDRDFDFLADPTALHDDLIQDLELGVLFQAMALGNKFLLEVSQRVLLAGLDDPEAIVYRQRILADCLTAPAVIRQMYAIADAALEDKRHLWGYNSHTPSIILSGAVNHLEAAVSRLKELRRIADLHAEKFSSVGLTNMFSTLQHELDDDYFQTIGVHLKQLRFRDGTLLSAELDRDNSSMDLVLRMPHHTKPSWRDRLGMGPRRSYSFTIPPRDDGGMDALSDLASRGVNLVANAAAQSSDHITSYFTVLRAELGFYVACLNLYDRLVARGIPIVFPEPAPAKPLELSATGLRDTCLALQPERAVIGVDADADDKALIVITGANSGGKSTFLRSVGLAQLMMQGGLFVTAGAYRANVARQVFTHFIREEDPTMTSGRLDEELNRMSVLADYLKPNCLMLFNESFAATNEREGSEIGRQVVRALVEAGIKVIFVTHQFDFADGLYQQHAETALFLRAPPQSGGNRDFHLTVAAPLPTSYGEDLYERLGGWLDDDGFLRAASTEAATGDEVPLADVLDGPTHGQTHIVGNKAG